jgi:hypothetical protein
MNSTRSHHRPRRPLHGAGNPPVPAEVRVVGRRTAGEFVRSRCKTRPRSLPTAFPNQVRSSRQKRQRSTFHSFAGAADHQFTATFLAPPGGFEPPTCDLGNRCSIRLSYGSGECSGSSTEMVEAAGRSGRTGYRPSSDVRKGSPRRPAPLGLVAAVRRSPRGSGSCVAAPQVAVTDRRRTVVQAHDSAAIDPRSVSVDLPLLLLSARAPPAGSRGALVAVWRAGPTGL